MMVPSTSRSLQDFRPAKFGIVQLLEHRFIPLLSNRFVVSYLQSTQPRHVSQTKDSYLKGGFDGRVFICFVRIENTRLERPTRGGERGMEEWIKGGSH